MKHSSLIVFSVALALSACSNSSQIQSKYNAQQDLCKAEAAAFSAAVSQQGMAADPSAVGVRFGECMNQSGWRVSMPKPAQTSDSGPAPNPPTGSPSTAPIATTVARPPAPPPHTSAPYSPPGTVPSAAARYQPARPLTVPPPDYGTGAGRRF